MTGERRISGGPVVVLDDLHEVLTAEPGVEVGEDIVVHGAERRVGSVLHPVVEGREDALPELGPRERVDDRLPVRQVDLIQV